MRQDAFDPDDCLLFRPVLFGFTVTDDPPDDAPDLCCEVRVNELSGFFLRTDDLPLTPGPPALMLLLLVTDATALCC